jgi:hypothetical protein
MLYDVTTLYFEADKEDDLRKVGYSKERRVDPQIVVDCWSTGPGSPWRSAVMRQQGRGADDRADREVVPGTARAH